MPTPLTILTGASRGLGLALAAQLLAQGHHVLAISRRRPDLPAGAGTLTHWAADLADPAPVAERLGAWLAALVPPTSLTSLTSATLINNAAVIATPAPLSAQDGAGLAQAVRVGLEAPLLLTAAFLRATAAWPVPRKVLLISSGLGRQAMPGQAPYCAVKAGLDHLARAVALEEAGLPHGARIVALAPGVIDTDMQQQLRAADPALFPERARFVALQAGGLLDTPAEAAAKVLRLLDRADFGSQPVTDVRQA